MNWRKQLAGWLGVCALGLIASCGGGGGSGGAGPYSISLRVDAASLPLNLAGEVANIGGRYTTTVYVSARDNGGRPIPGSEDSSFACSVVAGLDSGALYYLDGDPEHQTTEDINGVQVTTPNAYRSITLGSNAGNASFHLHASNIAGTVRIRCTVTEPDTNIQRSAEINIQVGGNPSGLVSQVIISPFSPNYLFPQGFGSFTQVQGQASIVDEAGQTIASPVAGVNNIEMNILSNPTTPAEDAALLRGVNAAGSTVSGKSIRVRSINGQALFTLVSGIAEGPITLEAVSDRADNNVDNGITERIFNLITVSVVTESPGSATPDNPLTIETTSLPAAAAEISYGAVLEASGGVAPYTWSLSLGSRLPSGLSLSTSGIITGTPIEVVSGTYNFVVQVKDATGATSLASLGISYTAAPNDPVVVESPPTVTTSSLADCTVGQACVRTVSASGGDTPYSWTAVGLPTGLSMSSTGVISGTPVAQGAYTFAVTATGSNGLSSTPKIVSLLVVPSGAGLSVLTTTLASGKVGTPYGAQLNAVGGTGTYTWALVAPSQLPAGLLLSPATGAINGTPTAAASNFTFRVEVDDGSTQVEKDVTITIAP